MEFSRQEYQSRLSFPPPEGLPDPGIKPRSLGSLALADTFFMKLKKSQNTSRTTCVWRWLSVPGGLLGERTASVQPLGRQRPRFPPLPSRVCCPDSGELTLYSLIRGYIDKNVSFLGSVQQYIIFIKEKTTLIEQLPIEVDITKK